MFKSFSFPFFGVFFGEFFFLLPRWIGDFEDGDFCRDFVIGERFPLASAEIACSFFLSFLWLFLVRVGVFLLSSPRSISMMRLDFLDTLPFRSDLVELIFALVSVVASFLAAGVPPCECSFGSKSSSSLLFLMLPELFSSSCVLSLLPFRAVVEGPFLGLAATFLEADFFVLGFPFGSKSSSSSSLLLLIESRCWSSLLSILSTGVVAEPLLVLTAVSADFFASFASSSPLSLSPSTISTSLPSST
mmetsp:Transcript_32922/g.79649  ORF Transcript_32922/g.79649 Transcript_32922/m.79649 type:complete len:246 (+) Transcript_32922:137-874(+)